MVDGLTDRLGQEASLALAASFAVAGVARVTRNTSARVDQIYQTVGDARVTSPHTDPEPRATCSPSAPSSDGAEAALTGSLRPSAPRGIRKPSATPFLLARAAPTPAARG